jgi:ribonuclease HI
MGSGGYILRDPKGVIRGGGGLYFGRMASTNNIAEIKAMLESLKKVHDTGLL